MKINHLYLMAILSAGMAYLIIRLRWDDALDRIRDNKTLRTISDLALVFCFGGLPFLGSIYLDGIQVAAAFVLYSVLMFLMLL